ncbi:hypothetical protein SLS56_009731 [Neofusicoccum ribis]|uniref:Uncharacterized protein n=1 Tax=Neofusicoccum ribis TaxID=45134 RepID=A0ABR3SGG3_9PEZI
MADPPQRHSAAPAASFDPVRPPPLHYSLRTRKKQIARFWLPLLLDCCILPVALFYSLRFATRLSDATVFAITTALIGGTLIIEFVLRGYHLWKRNSTCRPKGSPRAAFDWTHWVLLLAILVAVAELVVGNAFPEPLVRLLAMPAPSVLAVFAADVAVRDALHLAGACAPVRVSSAPAGAAWRPGIYVVVEDIVATDGGGETAFRERLDRRYAGSYMFRRMVRVLSLFWGLGGLAAALGTAALVWTLDRDVAYGVGWVAPFVWGLAWTLLTMRWVPRCLEREYASWTEARGLP